MKMKRAILFFFIITLVACDKTDDLIPFAQCLTENDATMYGTQWCSHCNDQKKDFGKSFAHINFVDCDKFPDECKNAGVNSYPTWIINDEKLTGRQSLGTLAYKAGCQLEE